MNEKVINEILGGVIQTLVDQLKGEGVSLPTDCAVSGETIPVELSARHAHLSEADAMELFGHPLTPARDLSQPGQFLAKERVRLIGPKGVMDNVAVLGPSRGSSQIEISQTDARILGVKAPVRQSGDIKDTPGIILASENSIVGLEQGVIVAARHIHMTPEDARRLCVSDNQLVSVRLDSGRPIILEDVLVRVNEQFKLSLHIDFDEGNGSGWHSKVTGRIVTRQ
ncbi:phosphate propanoyltransferase [Pseudodesulfovibrio cashew]|uniref:Phosphate propanoyltransferase n=1 Tax=Pseudodesulfovibrio cashew TaxID=2678688 RepID=A0A6I6JVY9_9BACT|nr:phosphate propanoyltransferase [Pseudodesulfovibrio cashew]QGY41894.1 phosphate propanoyltransferase [Pseudodesulfovibrio cashew]